LLQLPRRKKRLIQVGTDVLLVWFALWMAFIVRLSIDDMINPLHKHTWLFLSRGMPLNGGVSDTD
jgi:hypothetical protein